MDANVPIYSKCVAHVDAIIFVTKSTKVISYDNAYYYGALRLWLAPHYQYNPLTYSTHVFQ